MILEVEVGHHIQPIVLTVVSVGEIIPPQEPILVVVKRVVVIVEKRDIVQLTVRE